VSIAQSANTITATAGGTGVSSAQLTLSGSSRSTGATVNFSAAGQLGSSSRILISGVANNAVLAPWAIANSGDYATYDTTLGIGSVGSTGFRGYDGAFRTGNITNVSSTYNVLANTTTGRLRISGGATADIGFLGSGLTLTLEEGGLLRGNDDNATTIGVAGLGLYPGTVTAGTGSGTTELIVYNAQSTITMNSIIANNGGSGVVALVKSGAGTLALQPSWTVTNVANTAGSATVTVPDATGITAGMVVGGPGMPAALPCNRFPETWSPCPLRPLP